MPSFKAGDIILFNPDGKNGFVDWFITKVSKRTHVGFFVDSYRFIEASNPHGVRISKFDTRWKHVKVYRKPDLTYYHVVPAIVLGYEFVGDPYSVYQGVSAGLLRMVGLVELADKQDRNWNCSEFVAFLIRYGLKLPIYPGRSIQTMLPDDIETSLIESGWVSL
jgi:hypothetical protein